MAEDMPADVAREIALLLDLGQLVRDGLVAVEADDDTIAPRFQLTARGRAACDDEATTLEVAHGA